MKILSKTIQVIIFIIAIMYLYCIDLSEGKQMATIKMKDVNVIAKEITNENIMNVNNQVLAEETQSNSSEKYYEEISSQENLQKEDKVLGTIIIDKIEFEGTVYEGTTQDILKKGVGHFKNSPYLNGNVCLAAHNTKEFWSELKTIEVGDKITYNSFLGTKRYVVYEKTQINENDWIRLEDTNENILTLITCVKGEREKRLCVQAREII